MLEALPKEILDSIIERLTFRDILNLASTGNTSLLQSLQSSIPEISKSLLPIKTFTSFYWYNRAVLSALNLQTTHLSLPAQNFHADLIEWWIRKGCLDVDRLLPVAVKYRKVLVVERLVGIGADVNGKMVLANACRGVESGRMIDVLVGLGCDLRHPNSKSALFYAVDDVELMKRLLENGVGLDAVRKHAGCEMESPLAFACRVGDVEVVKMLIEKGAVVGWRMDMALRNAVRRNRVDLVELLLEARGDLNLGSMVRDEKVFLILMAAGLKDAKVLSALMTSKGGTLPKRMDKKVVYAACQRQNLEVVDWMMEHRGFKPVGMVGDMIMRVCVWKMDWVRMEKYGLAGGRIYHDYCARSSILERLRAAAGLGVRLSQEFVVQSRWDCLCKWCGRSLIAIQREAHSMHVASDLLLASWACRENPWHLPKTCERVSTVIAFHLYPCFVEKWTGSSEEFP
ncbi:hypothetical protein HDU97_003818 [Phlyctochytrium planicorne]|nr:hypothetical protein HDU97_003818 [Phlyctochytrium planicorne]